MLALGLLLTIGIYAALLIFAFRRTHRWVRNTLVFLLVGPVVYTLADIPVGYVRFRMVCASEAGVQVRQADLPIARVVRLQGGSVFDARTTLSGHPSLQAVEARNETVPYTAAAVYARYFRKTDGQVGMEAIDKFERKASGENVIEAGTSSADYVIREETIKTPIRLLVRRQILERSDGTRVGTAAGIDYHWSNPSHSFLGQSFISSCGIGNFAKDGLIKLVTTPREKNDNR
jgi:hypothetical protein